MGWLACGGTKDRENQMADQESQLETLRKEKAEIEVKYAEAMGRLNSINDQLHLMIIPRTVDEIRELERRMEMDPEINKTWTEEDEQELLADDALVACLQTANEWIFDSFRLDDLTGGFPLPKFGFWMFKEHGLLSEFKIPTAKLFNFLRRIQAKYKPTLYHNVIHAVDVAQAMHFWMRRGLLSENANSLQVMAALLAGMCHDTGHPAKNNAFMVNSKNKFATLYNDISVLENMHLSLLFETYNEPECDFLCNLSREEWQSHRKGMVGMILATDFGRHNEILSIAQERLKQGRMDLQKEADFDLTMKVGIKCADLRHCMMPHEMTQRTTALLMEEFWGQGDEEAALGLPISPFMNREKANLNKEQAGFYQFMIMPLINVWAEILPSEASVALDYSKRNWEAWQKKGAKKHSKK